MIHSNIKITNKLTDLLIAAKEQAELSLFRQRHGAILVRGNRIINKAFNSGKFSAFAERFNKDKRFFASRHAELNCILGISKKLTTGSIIVVVRINKENKFRNSYPCQMCQSVCAFVGITKIIYTADENTINEIIF